MNLSIDPTEFREVIAHAVNATAERLYAERQTDESGKLLRGKQAASQWLSMSVSSLDRLVAGGEIEVVRLAGRVLFSEQALRGWVARKEAESRWGEIIAQEPRLAELSQSIKQSTPPTTEPGYGRRWMEISAKVGRLAGPLGHTAYLIALDHLHRLYTDAALRASGVDA